jgi:DNA-binding Lrp family transcriptional regulator
MKYNNERDLPIIRFLQGDIPLQSHPLKDLAAEMAISEEEVLERITALQGQGVMRRWGAVLRHQKAGYKFNAMTAWKVDSAEADRIGEIMATRSEISHCYLRNIAAGFGYNMFTMVHARSAEELNNTINYIAELTGLDDYVVLKSVREFKKESMRYF